MVKKVYKLIKKASSQHISGQLHLIKLGKNQTK
jgi:hypothetical protein